MTLLNEPVRGSIPPLWFPALTGLERLAAMQAGLIAKTPLEYLYGFQVQQFAPGSVTISAPANASNVTYTGVIDCTALIATCLLNATMTALPAGAQSELISLHEDGIRPARPTPGQLLARGRVT